METAEKKPSRGGYHVVQTDGARREFPNKKELTKHLEESGTEHVAHIFKGHVLSLETQTVQRVSVN